jgi:hypothetical protein
MGPFVIPHLHLIPLSLCPNGRVGLASPSPLPLLSLSGSLAARLSTPTPRGQPVPLPRGPRTEPELLEPLALNGFPASAAPNGVRSSSQQRYSRLCPTHPMSASLSLPPCVSSSQTFFPLLQSYESKSSAAPASQARRHEGLRQDAQGLKLWDRSGTLQQGTLRRRCLHMVPPPLVIFVWNLLVAELERISFCVAGT